jgi:leucyl aminopeptidase
MTPFVTSKKPGKTAIPIITVTEKSYTKWLKTRSKLEQNLLSEPEFSAKPGSFRHLKDNEGKITALILGISGNDDIWNWAAIPEGIKNEKHYYPQEEASNSYPIVLGWQLGCYQYERYKEKRAGKFPTLHISDNATMDSALAMAESIFLTRHLINTPTNDLGPSEFSAEIRKVGKDYKARFKEISGEDLLRKNYPTIHAVGRACDDEPRLVTLEWGNPEHPRLTLVGKGVCFDTGGLNIKPDKSMGMMKKDMGGAGFMLGLAKLIMHQQLKVHLKVYLPLVENSISANAYRPQDVIKTRKGITVEISNTDAEGRLILCDALAEADSEKPELLIDAATLTGAARVAMGTEIPAFFTPSEKLAKEVQKHCEASNEMLWRLPLWEEYRYMLNSDIADIDHCASSGYAGATTAALFLKEFVEHTSEWMHIDMMAWNTRSRPGRPKGGEAQGMRALYSLLEARFGKA